MRSSFYTCWPTPFACSRAAAEVSDLASYAPPGTVCLGSNGCPKAKSVQEFCEECDGDIEEKPFRVVRRDSALKDNKQLPRRLQLQVGRTILEKMRAGFRDETFECPAPLRAGASPSMVASAVQELLQSFVANGFAIKARLSDVATAPGSAGTMTWSIRVDGGANLWGLQALQARRALLSDSFDSFAVLAFLDAAGFDAQFSLEATDAYVDQTWTVRPRTRAA